MTDERKPRERTLLDDAARVLAFATLAAIVIIAVRPFWKDLSTFGFHDWDSQTAHRYLAKVSLLHYHQFPSWNPYACGGFTAWGYVEADTTLVSPFFPVYLLLPIQIALRVEVTGMAAIGALGAYAIASRFTKSQAARVLVAALWAVNGRWGLQTAAGHTWHLAYAYLPWCFYFFERARAPERSVRDLLGAGVAIAMLVYAGGIYPLPHTAMALGIYALLLAIFERSARPAVTLAICGVIGIGLAAPKLLPVIEGFGKVPRLIESNETLEIGALYTMLTSRDQAFYSRPAHVAPYGWHEWGIYISFAGALALVLAFALVRGKREAALKVIALFYVLLGFGAYGKEAPWTLIHNALPIFKSQHVPSRFLYPAILFLAIIAAAGMGRAIERWKPKAPWIDFAAGCLVLALAVDVAAVAARPMADAMWMVPPDKIAARAFHHEQEPPLQYKRRDWAGPMYLAMLANTGVINCYGTPPFDRHGARAVGDPRYHGEVFFPAGKGTGTVADWTPNRVVLDVQGADAGDVLVYNMNYDEGWSARGGAVENVGDAIGVRLSQGSGQVVLTYSPPLLGTGIALFVLTVAGVALALRREKREGFS